MKTDMVVGLYMDEDKVLLILKKRPEWQKGRFNGVGGHVEHDEAPRNAMAREFEEETGITVEAERWTLFCVLHGEWGTVWFYRTHPLDTDSMPRSTTDERLMWSVLTDLDRTIHNLRWLIPMAHSEQEHDWPFSVWERTK